MAAKTPRPRRTAPQAPAPVQAPLEPQALALPRPDGWWRPLALALAVIEPAAGLLLALLYWRSPDAEAKRFSRWALALAILGALLGLALGAAKGGLDGSERFIQPY